jgi:CheY-like chemotaxis protein
MPRGGTITVTAENAVLGEKTDLPLAAGSYVKIAIQDQGMGIDPSHLGKIFDPYFSTKQKGSGLGLATSFSILKKHGGHLTAASQLGEGATFTLYLPAASSRPSPEPEVDTVPVKGHGRILVMDDEPLVREIAGRMLQHLGYEVEYAAHGVEALGKYVQGRDGGAPFAAVILDLTVPGGMGGKETMEKLRILDPQVKAIMSSGYADDPLMVHFINQGFKGVMKKPYRVKDMSDVLATVLKG